MYCSWKTLQSLGLEYSLVPNDSWARIPKTMQCYLLLLQFALVTQWLLFFSFTFELQYSSQIVETGAICLEFSPNFLHSLLTPSFSVKCTSLLSQCWATRILEHWDDCDTQINIGEGENHTSISRFVTSIVFALGGRGRVTKRKRGNYFHL